MCLHIILFLSTVGGTVSLVPACPTLLLRQPALTAAGEFQPFPQRASGHHTNLLYAGNDTIYLTLPDPIENNSWQSPQQVAHELAHTMV